MIGQGRASRLTLREIARRHGEAAMFWLLAAAYVLPIWAFTYVPTQDGPSHLVNAQILKDYADPTAGYAQFFEPRNSLVPNLTSHLLLAALLYVVPALVAEKLLVSLYVLGFAGAFRYFLGAFGDRCRPLSLAGLLFVYQRCLWMGFFNYCLSLVLLWLVLGYCLRRRGTLGLSHAAMLMFLFLAAFFTHLSGFMLAFAGALGATTLVPPRRLLSPILVVLAALPAVCLTLDFFDETGFYQAPAAERLINSPLAPFRGVKNDTNLLHDLDELDGDLIEYHAGARLSCTVILVCYLGLLGVLSAGSWAGRSKAEAPGRLFPALFAVVMLAAYLLAPERLGYTHGDFLKPRLAPLPFLFCLACLREPTQPRLRLLARCVTITLLAVNLAFVTQTVHDGNQRLAEYTAGAKAVGGGHRIFVDQKQSAPSPLADPLLHAANYYCLGNGNVNLDNYEAATNHFPVKFRRGITRGHGFLGAYSQRNAVDIVICWQPPQGVGCRGPEGWDEIFQRGSLRIYRRH